MASADAPQPKPSSADLRLAALALGLLALALLGWRSFLPLGRDQSLFYVLGREWLGGAIPYRDLFDHKPPGVLVVYLLAYLLDGGAGWAIGLLDTLATGATAWLLFTLVLGASARRDAAWGAALISLVCARSPWFGGWWALGQPEVFQELALAAALVCGQRGRWVAMGLALAFALALKFTLIACVPVLLGWVGWRGARWAALSLVGAAAALVLLAWSLGALEDAWSAIIRFNLRHAGVGSVSLLQISWPLFLPPLLKAVPAAMLGALAGLAGARRFASPLTWVSGGLLVAALSQVVIQGKYWSWHWNPIILPMSLLAGPVLAALWRGWVGRVLVVLCLGSTVVQLGQQAQARFAPASREEMLAGYRWGRHDFSALENEHVGAWLKAAAAPGDRLLVWGFEAGFYLRSGLRPGTKWLYDYPVSVGLSEADRAQALAVIATQLHDIRWLVVLRRDGNNLEAEDSWTQLRGLAPLREALAADYTHVATIDDAEVFERTALR